MRVRLGVLMGAAVIVLGHSVAQAQDRVGWLGRPYVSLYGGASFLEDADVDIEDLDLELEAEFDPGFVVGATVGYYLHNWPWYARIEGDFSYRRHKLDELDVRETGVTDIEFDAGGNIDTFGLLVNYWIDVPNATPVTPYFGAGIGLGIYRADDIDLPEFGAEIADDTALALAWQLGAGVAWRITPQISVSADYRWFNSTDPELDLSGTDAEFELEASSHNAIAGVRFDF